MLFFSLFNAQHVSDVNASILRSLRLNELLCVTHQLVDSPFTVGRGVVVSGQFNQVGYGVAAFICYPDVCISEYVCVLCEIICALFG